MRFLRNANTPVGRWSLMCLAPMWSTTHTVTGAAFRGTGSSNISRALLLGMLPNRTVVFTSSFRASSLNRCNYIISKALNNCNDIISKAVWTVVIIFIWNNLQSAIHKKKMTYWIKTVYVAFMWPKFFFQVMLLFRYCQTAP